MEILLGKTKVVRNWRWHYEEILEIFSEIILVKLRKTYEEILQKLWKSMGNASHKLKKKHFETSKISR